MMIDLIKLGLKNTGQTTQKRSTKSNDTEYLELFSF